MHHCVCVVVLAVGSKTNPVESTDLHSAHTDDFDSIELLQTRFTRPRSLGQEDVGIQAWMDDAEKTLLSMSSVMDDIQDGTSTDPDPATTLANFKTMMETTMQVFLQDEHDEDQIEFNEKKLQLNDCGSARRWESGGDVANAKAELVKWQAKHQACRASQQAWLNYKTEAANCASEVATEHEVLPSHDTLVNLVGTAHQKAEAYDDLEPMGKRSCDLDQTSFEDQFCALRSVNYYACAAAQDCATQIGLSVLRTRLLVRALNRRNLWMTMAKLICRVDHLSSVVGDDSTGDDSTDLSDFNTTETPDPCAEENLAFDATKFVLDVAIPSSPDCIDAVADISTSSDLIPSTTNGAMCTQFRQVNYAWDQGLHVVPSVCLATCPQISYTTWAPPAECTNEPTECVFYNHHRDACGSYDTVDFVAGDSCCACGNPAPTPAPNPAPATSGQHTIYRMEVSKGGTAEWWCIEELSFYDAEGTRFAVDKARGSASSVYGDDELYGASMAFNEESDDNLSFFCTYNEQNTGWIQYEFENPTAVASYKIQVYDYANYWPEKWQMKTSDDGGATWIVLDDQSEVAVTWNDSTIKSFDLA